MSVGKSTIKFAGVLCAAALAFTLSACSGGQSVAEACKVAEETVAEANDQMQELVADAMTGDGDMKSLFTPVKDALNAAEKKVSNTEVSDALKNVNTEFTKMADVLGDFKMPSMDDIDMSDPDSMEKLTEMQGELEAMSDELQENSEAMEDAGTKLQELCNI